MYNGSVRFQAGHAKGKVLMQLEIKECGNDQFCRDAVNVLFSFRSIIKKHDQRIIDWFRRTRTNLIISLILLGLFVLSFCVGGYKILINVLAFTLLVITTLFNLFVFISVRRVYKDLNSDSRRGVLALDENGIEFRTEDGNVKRNSWTDVAVVRIHGDCMAFIPSSTKKTIFLVHKRLKDDISGWLKENRPEIEII